MAEVEIHLEKCFGIKRFKHKSNFGESKTHLVYAPNGVMKSSLALTMEDLAEGKVSKFFKKRVQIGNIVFPTNFNFSGNSVSKALMKFAGRFSSI